MKCKCVREWSYSVWNESSSRKINTTEPKIRRKMSSVQMEVIKISTLFFSLVKFIDFRMRILSNPTFQHLPVQNHIP